jgi:hypothetical protein
MKQFATVFSIASLILLAANARAGAGPVPASPITFKLAAYTQQPYELTSSKTNQNTASTNTTSVHKSTVRRIQVKNEDILNLLANSFSTNFPAGSQLAGFSSSLYVVDATGTNIFLDISGVLYFEPAQTFWAGTDTQTKTEDNSGTQSTYASSYSGTGTAKLTFDDGGRITANGAHTVVHIQGFVTTKNNYKNNQSKASFTFSGQGNGIVEDVATILSGTITGSGPGPVINN